MDNQDSFERPQKFTSQKMNALFGGNPALETSVLSQRHQTFLLLTLATWAEGYSSQLVCVCVCVCVCVLPQNCCLSSIISKYEHAIFAKSPALLQDRLVIEARGNSDCS